MSVTIHHKSPIAASRPLLTMEDVDRWAEELRSLLQAREETNRRIEELQRKLSAASLFVQEASSQKVMAEAEARIEQPDLLPPDTSQSATESAERPPTTMQDAILRLIKRHPDGLEPKDISVAIRSDKSLSQKIRESHPNYLYTVLMRLAVKNEIYKEGSVYKPV